jgi:hypothetical protein
MITIFPVSPLPILPLIEFLPGPPSDQLDRIRDYVSFTIVSDKEVDVVGGHHVVEHAQAEALLRFEKPLQVSASVSGKF